MELALVRDGASSEQGGRGLRIKLHFEDRDILSPEQLDEGLSDSWFLLHPRLRSIADLAADIASAFHLLKACPHGVSLRMEDFSLPPSQPVWLLKDKDVVSVNKKGVPINSVHQGIKHIISSSLGDSDTFDKSGPLGVKPRALEEFERETGGYESEEEEDAPHEDLDDMAKAPMTSSKKSKQKKRKRDGRERVDEQERNLKLQVVPYTEGRTGKKEKKSKKHRLIMQQDDKEEKVFATDELQKCQKNKKGRELGSSKANGTKKQKRVTDIGSRNDVASDAEEPKHGAMKSSHKKVSLSTRVDEQERNLKLQVVPYTEGRIGKKEKKSKKQRLIMQQDDKEEKVFSADELQECQKDKKGRELGSSKSNGTRKQKRVTDIGSRNDVSSDAEEPTVKKHCAMKSSHKKVSFSTSSSDEKLQNEQKKPALQVERGSVKKPSRSTLRKKAKRHWKREHGEELAMTNREKPADGPSKTAARSEATKLVSLTFPTTHEDDGEAEEERLPLVVRPGHIRFEPLDEDNDDSVHAQHTLPLFGFNNGISKRKGQSWGQEKTRRGSKNSKDCEDMEICDSQTIVVETLPPLEVKTIVFETLPLLEVPPQDGDVIAYRLLELTPSFCPEVSEYRVGKVVDLENHSGMLKLAEVPKYPLQRRREDLDAGMDGGIYFPSLYDEEGFLETQMSSLVDIRLVEGGSHGTHKIESSIQLPTELAATDNHTNSSAEAMALLSNTEAAISKSPTELAATDNHTNYSAEAMALLSNTEAAISKSPTELAATDNHTNYSAEAMALLSNTEAAISKSLITNPNSSEARSPTREKSATPYSAWQEISEELDRKKEELAKREGITSTALQTRPTELDELKIGDGSSCAGDNNKKASIGRPKAWFKRAGGLGSTMALLRSQNHV